MLAVFEICNAYYSALLSFMELYGDNRLAIGEIFIDGNLVASCGNIGNLEILRETIHKTMINFN